MIALEVVASVVFLLALVGFAGFIGVGLGLDQGT
jgi:hypothetical protein